jgi:hypothetical protein
MNIRRSPLLAARLAPLAFCLAASPAHAVTYFGSLGNFDVVNNTPGETHGFEIELEGVSSKQVTFSFGAPYQYRYGTPKLVDYTATDPATNLPVSGVRIRYESPYDPTTQTFKQATPVAPNPTMQTAGHQCWWMMQSAQLNNYLASGCEHFGVGVIGNPSKTTYRWLAADPAVPGNLTYAKDPNGAVSKVSLPAPVLALNAVKQVPPPPPPVQNVPPAPPAPPQPAPAVQVQVEAPELPEPAERQPGQEYGDAVWVKVFTTEAPEPRKLEELMTDDAKVPQEAAEVEVEWQLMQKPLDPAKGGGRDKLDDNPDPADPNNPNPNNQRHMAQGNESVTKRYEFYEYAGPYDPETHEAKPAGGDSNPAPGDIGKYQGAQNVAINVLDADSDGVKDDAGGGDNCVAKPNPDQRDTDGDGFGNLCDADLNQDFIIDNNDLNALKGQFNKKASSGAAAANADFNGDGKVNYADLAILKSQMGQAPGPGKAQ